ncbi:cysteine proteinase [Phanerochaete sordida]|uniref:Cysteine proteinase n=1 Tax=Phanerochaete sordida TaxID=48140 RepID=A0A9P3GG18_9APHY|nr:cysteine proteinase [Phanerochaete sordida]
MSSRGTSSQEAQTLYTRATRAELSGDFSLAFKLYVKSAEEFLHLSRTASDASVRGKWKAEAAKALGRAEKIKAKKDVAPVVSDPFSEREQQLVLQKSSVVNGRTYPVWTGPGSSQRTDLTQPGLSEEQQRLSASWRKPVAADGTVCSSVDSLLPEDVTQHIVSDCSFCASIAVCIAHNRAFGTKLAVSSLYPQDSDGLPTADDIHSVRIMFNGALRRVDIDADLPCHPDGSTMCISTGAKRELWPALLEKAYMKLMGGYEFPGSLSSTDLYTLTGWIPEHVEIASQHFERERTWKRLSSAFSQGRCMGTLGTGAELRQHAIDSIPLLPAHSYAIIDIVDHEDERTLVLLDPWEEPVIAQDGIGDGEPDVSKLSLEDSDREASRIYRVSWDEACILFDGIYFSWDPQMFSHHLNFHGTWKKDSSAQDALPSHRQLDLRLSLDQPATGDTEVWILLTRHTVDTKRSGEFISLSANDPGSTSLDVLKGEYTNNTQMLVRATASEDVISLTASYDGPYDDVGFTVTAYASVPVFWKTETFTLPYTEKATGAFIAGKNAGGNPALPTFMTNPQYHLRLHPDDSAAKTGRDKKVRTRLSLHGDRRVPLNILAVWSNGQRIADFAQNDVACSSGAYNYGYASVSKELRAGDYTVVVSAFDSRHLGPFILNVECGARFELKPIPQEGAGMFCKPIRGEWTAETAAGAPQFERYKRNPVYELKLSAQSQVLIRLQLSDRNPNVSLNATLFQLKNDGTLGSLVATSGPYAETVCGVALGPVTAQAGSYAIIPSTFNPGVCMPFRLLVYTSTSSTSVNLVTLSR